MFRIASARTPMFVLSLALPLIATKLDAQMVTGEVVSAEDGAPIRGAFVVLLNAEGRRQAAYITDREGRYALRAAAAGDYMLRVEQIGFETVTSPVLRLGSGTTSYTFVVPTRAVVLPGITVETDNRGCARRRDGPQVQSLWEEVRKALDVTAFTQQSDGVRYTVVEQLRETAGNGRLLLREERTARVIAGAHPYRTGAGPAELVSAGFARRDGDDFVLLGPDAFVLLADEFLEGYCFRIEAGAAPGEIGLAFEPVRRRSTTDVRGVLWVDRNSSELRRLSYSYTGLPGHLARHDAGGDIHFTRLPNGTWIVSQWWIRTPLLLRQATSRTTWQYGTREEGGTVVTARQGDEALYDVTGTAVVEGRVHDRVHDAAGVGMLVFLSGTPFAAVADEDGWFRLDGVPAGRYAMALASEWLLDARVPVRLDSVMVTAGGTLRHDVATPSFAEAMRALCPGMSAGSAQLRYTAVYGVVLDAATGAPMADVAVRADFRARNVTVRTGSDGRYAICWLPQETDIAIRVTTRGRQTPQRIIRSDSPLLRHDIY
jgi:hypothetical protein